MVVDGIAASSVPDGGFEDVAGKSRGNSRVRRKAAAGAGAGPAEIAGNVLAAGRNRTWWRGDAVTRVTGISGGVVAGGKASAAPRGGFRVSGETQASQTGEARAAQGVGLAGMLALQEAETETESNRKGRRHGFALLDALRDVQRGLLDASGAHGGGITGLLKLADQAPSVTNPRLGEVLAAIRLRAKIELLRRGVDAP